MPQATRRVYTAEVRDLASHHSDTASGDADVTVTTDTLHTGGESNLFERHDQLRIYVQNTQDQGVDYTVEHAEPADTDFTDSVTGTTTTVSAGAIHSETLDGPVGRLRHQFHVPGTTAATSGHVKMVVIAV